MNSFRPLVYLPDGANATRVFCRDSGLVQGLLSPLRADSRAERAKHARFGGTGALVPWNDWPSRFRVSTRPISGGPTVQEAIRADGVHRWGIGQRKCSY